MEESCCFTGHRAIPEKDKQALWLLLRKAVRDCAGAGKRRFLCGGALGFDTMAALAVLKERELLPELRLCLVLPCRDMDKHWKQADREVLRSTLERADETVWLAESYYKGCMLTRDRYLVDHSSLCVCYLTEAEGGTAYTVAYAVKQGVEVVNLALAL